MALRALGSCHVVCVSLPWDCAQTKDGDSCLYETRSASKAGAVFPAHGEPLKAGRTV